MRAVFPIRFQTAFPLCISAFHRVATRCLVVVWRGRQRAGGNAEFSNDGMQLHGFVVIEIYLQNHVPRVNFYANDVRFLLLLHFACNAFSLTRPTGTAIEQQLIITWTCAKVTWIQPQHCICL